MTYTYALIVDRTEIASVTGTNPITMAAEIVTRAQQFANIMTREDEIAADIASRNSSIDLGLCRPQITARRKAL